MPTSTRTVLRRALSEESGDYFSFTASADGSSNKDSIVADILRNQPLGTDPDGFEERFFLSVDGSNSGEARRCKNYAPDSVNGAEVITESTFTSATAKDDTFEMHRIDPDLKHIAIKQALLEMSRVLYLPKRDETLIVDSILTNGDFETFTVTNVPDDWTSVNSPTLTEENTIVFHGTSSLKMVGPSGSVGRVYQDLAVNIDDAAGKTLLFKMRAHTNAASQARLILDFGSSTEEGEYHDGDSDWQLLSVDSAIPTDATRTRVICEVTADDIAYFDTGWAAVDPLYQYDIPSSIIRLMHLEQQFAENFPAGPYYPLLPNQPPTRGRILRLRGPGVLSSPTTESGTTEIGEPRVRLFAAYAALRLVEVLGERSAAEQITNLERRMTRWERTVARLSTDPSIRMPSMSAKKNQPWHVEYDITNKIVFDIQRGGIRSGIGFTS